MKNSPSYPICVILFIVFAFLFTTGHVNITNAGNKTNEAEQMQTEPSDPADQNIRAEDHNRHVLIFSKTAGFRHGSIEAGRSALIQRAEQENVTVYATEDATYFTPENLLRYHAVVFLNTTGTVFNDTQRKTFEDYIRDGGGFVGVHSASDTEYDWPWYGKLVGAYFDSHPRVSEATVRNINTDHPATHMLAERWRRTDEWYNFQVIPDHVNVLLALDTDSYDGSAHPDYHPIAWYHEYDGGRSFYTGMGHTNESYSDPVFMDHLWGGIRYAMGKP